MMNHIFMFEIFQSRKYWGRRGCESLKEDKPPKPSFEIGRGVLDRSHMKIPDALEGFFVSSVI